MDNKYRQKAKADKLNQEREEIERIMDAAAIAAETIEALMPNRSYKSPCSSRLGLISACEEALKALEEIGIYGSRLTVDAHGYPLKPGSPSSCPRSCGCRQKTLD